MRARKASALSDDVSDHKYSRSLALKLNTSHIGQKCMSRVRCPPCTAYTDELKMYFSNRALKYEKDNDFHPRLARKLVEFLRPNPGDKVLDVATGTGYVALEVARKLGRQGLVVGVDISKPMLEQVDAKWNEDRDHLAPCILLEADIEQINFHGPCFQHITCSASLPFLKDLPAFFSKARSWLSPGGCVIFNTPEEPYSLLKPLLFSVYQDFGIPAVNTGPMIGSAELIKETLRSAGFTDIQVEREQEEKERHEIIDAGAYVEAQWSAMLNMPMAEFAGIDTDTADAAYQQFCKEGLSCLDRERDKDRKLFSKPLTTLWTVAK